jgi:FecR protein
MTQRKHRPTERNASLATPPDEDQLDDAVRRLTELARAATGDALTAGQQAGIHRLERTLRNKDASGERFRLRWLVVPAAMAAAGGAYVLRERAITFEVVGGMVGDGGYVAAGATLGAVRFSDHSDFDLDPGTRLRISDLEVRGARVMLEGGLLHVRIHPRPRGSWTLAAGPYVVHVTGTEFDLAWRVDEQTLDLRLHHGSVTVEGPLAEAGLKVATGQHLIANATTGTLSLVDELNPNLPSLEAPTVSPTPIASAAPAGAFAFAPVEPAPVPSPVAVRSRASDTPPSRAIGSRGSGRTEPQSWAVRASHGDFNGVLEDAERRGLDRSLLESPVVDLAALADAARYARRQDVARRALVAERTRFPGSLQARDAPFFLGGLAQAQKNDAGELDWYELYLRESPNGVYASEALGRKMMLVQRLKGIDAARPIASDYLDRFRDGPYAPSARKLLQVQ